MANDAKIKADISFLKQHAAAGTTGNVSSPTKAIQAQLANTTITQQPINHMPQGDMFSSSSGRGGNLFPKSAHPPAMEAEKATLKANLELYPIQPATPEGEVAYLDQLRAWRQTNGPNHITKTTGFLLQPGEAPPGSGECYNCGQTGHRCIDCQATKKIPSLEASFYAICGSILGQPSRHTTQINYVAASGGDEFAWLNMRSNEQQGNGEGSSAL